MICEKCGCHDRVMRTVRRQDRVVRIRRCITCGHMVTTEETKIENPTTTKPAPKRVPEPTPVKSAKPRKRKQKAEPPKKDDSAKGALAQAMAQAK